MVCPTTKNFTPPLMLTPQKTPCERDVENETLLSGCPCQPAPSRAEWLEILLTLWKPLSKWHSLYLMLFLVCCGEWSLPVRGPVSRDPRFLLAMARGQQDSLFVVSESLQKRTPLYLRGTPGHSNSHTPQVLLGLVHHPSRLRHSPRSRGCSSS